MEITINTSKYAGLDLKKRTELYVANGIGIENLKWYVDTIRNSFKPLTLKNLKLLCPKLDATIPKEPSPVNHQILKDTFTLQSAVAISQISDSKASVTTENIVSLGLMANQMQRFDILFQGGDVPTYHMAKKPDDETKIDEKQEKIGQIRVVSGVAVFGKPVCEVYKNMGFKSITPATSYAVNAGVIVAVTMKFNNDNDCIMHPYVPTKLSVPGVERQMLSTGFANIAQTSFKHKPCSVYTIVADIAKKSDTVEMMLKPYEIGSLGQSVVSVQRTPMIAGCSFSDTPRDILKQWHAQGLSQLGKAKQLVKDSDTGFKAMNAPMKWKWVLEILAQIDIWCQVNVPKKVLVEDREEIQNVLEDRQADLVIAFYGAAGGRARRVFENKASVVAYDVKESPSVTKKVSEDDFIKYKIDRWITKDIFQHEVFSETAFVSDIFMDSWKGKIDPDGHKFVSGVIRGQIVNDSLVTCKKLPSVRAVKGFIPSTEQLRLYDGTYPFAVFRVCRPITSELIYLKVDTDDQFDQLKDYVAETVKGNPTYLKDRIKIIIGPNDFEAFLKFTTVCICEELNFQQRKLSLDPRIIMASPHNRKWSLEPDELPCLFVPKHMRVNCVNSMDNNSALFGGVVEGESWTDEDFAGIAEIDRAELGDGGEARALPGNVPTQVVNFNDD